MLRLDVGTGEREELRSPQSFDLSSWKHGVSMDGNGQGSEKTSLWRWQADCTVLPPPPPGSPHHGEANTRVKGFFQCLRV